jgi:hypothetical protein
MAWSETAARGSIVEPVPIRDEQGDAVRSAIVASAKDVGTHLALKPEAESLGEETLEYRRCHLTFKKAPKVVAFGADVSTTSTENIRGLSAPWHDTQFTLQKGAKTSPPEVRR